MKVHVDRRVLVMAAVLGAVALMTAGFFAALAIRSALADPGGPVPNPGHQWTELQDHGLSGSDYWLGTIDSNALELHVNGERALRLEPDATSPNVIGGHSGNSVSGGVYGATISGGGNASYPNAATDDYGTVGGGERNRAGNDADPTDDATHATVGGGFANTASGSSATVSGGVWNTASGHNATVGGGDLNAAGGLYATVGGGLGNGASGESATVPGGRMNLADGNYSFAAGYRAKANNQGCFVWGDATDADVSCNDDNRFIVRASGGVYLYTSSDLSTGAYLAAGSGSWSLVTDLTCESIQRQIDELGAGGGLVVVPAGTYTCTAPIVIDRDNVELRGEGPGTVLRLADDANAPVLVLGQTIPTPTVTRQNISISDLVIEGNRMNQEFECWGGPCDATHVIRNNGITLRHVSDALIERVTVSRARSGGLVSELGSRRLTVRDFTAFDNHFDGLAGYETEDSTFSGLYLHDNLAAGLSFDIAFHNNIVGEAVITDTGSVGIFMRDSRDNLFHDIAIRNSVEHGVFLAQVDGDPTKPAAGNTFSGLVVSESGGDGLRANDASVVDTLVVEAQFVGNSGECIAEVFEDQVKKFGIICR